MTWACFSYDQGDGGGGRYSLVTAFEGPSMPEGVPVRESIELRHLVLYD